MNEKYKEYLKNLSPELQEKARDINTQEELMEFLSDNDVELPEDALEAVSGGCGSGKCEHENATERESFDALNADINCWGFFRCLYCSKCGSTVYQFRRSDGANYEYFDIGRETYDQSKARKLTQEGKAAVNKFIYFKGRGF